MTFVGFFYNEDFKQRCRSSVTDNQLALLVSALMKYGLENTEHNALTYNICVAAVGNRDSKRTRERRDLWRSLQPLRWQRASKTWECFGRESPSVSVSALGFNRCESHQSLTACVNLPVTLQECVLMLMRVRGRPRCFHFHLILTCRPTMTAVCSTTQPPPNPARAPKFTSYSLRCVYLVVYRDC